MEGLVALSIPIFGIVGGICLVFAMFYFNHRKREMQHQERLRALELGIELPPLEQEDEGQGDPYGNLKAAVILIFLGVAFATAALTTDERDMLIPACIMASLGVAFLFIHFLVYRLKRREEERRQDSGTALRPGEELLRR